MALLGRSTALLARIRPGLAGIESGGAWPHPFEDLGAQSVILDLQSPGVLEARSMQRADVMLGFRSVDSVSRIPERQIAPALLVPAPPTVGASRGLPWF
jgi:hypothetical protein